MSVVAVVDTGVNINHFDLRSNLWRNPGEIAGNNIDDDGNGVIDDVHGLDVITGSGISSVGDPEGHGTHVAGIVATTSKNAEIMGIRILNENGGGSLSSAIEAFSYALVNGATVINNSYGALGVNPSQVDFLQEAIRIGEEDYNVVFVAAAGNEAANTDQIPNTPSNAEGMFSVGASTSVGNPASFSNFGATTVDLFAPGVDILSADTFSTNGRKRLSGTSMASPVVAGAAAILQDINPDASVADIKAKLMDGSIPQKNLQGLAVTGGVLSNDFTGSFTQPLESTESTKGNRKKKKSSKKNKSIGSVGSLSKKSFDKIICVLDKPTQSEKMDIWNDLMDQDFTKNVEWPEAFGDRICVLNLRNRYQSGPESKAAIKMMRRSKHFESVERDRKILVNTDLNSFSTSLDRVDVSLSPLDLILPSQGDVLI
jgi:subtilisin family serine protease